MPVQASPVFVKFGGFLTVSQSRTRLWISVNDPIRGREEDRPRRHVSLVTLVSNQRFVSSRWFPHTYNESESDSKECL